MLINAWLKRTHRSEYSKKIVARKVTEIADKRGIEGNKLLETGVVKGVTPLGNTGKSRKYSSSDDFQELQPLRYLYRGGFYVYQIHPCI